MALNGDQPAGAHPPRVGLVGYFGWGNFGDELMYELWRSALGDGVRVERVHTLLHRPYFEEPASSVADRHDVLLVGGGDLVLPDSVSALYWNRAWLRRPVVVSGVGVALERPTRPDVAARLGAFLADPAVRHLGVRDAGSAAWLRDTAGVEREVRVAPDLGFAATLPAPAPVTPDASGADGPGRPTVGIVLRKEPGADDVATVRHLSAWADRQGLATELLVLATGRTADAERAALRDAFGPDVTVREEGDVAGLCARLGGYHAVFTAKYHGAVVALRYGVPVVSIRSTHKIGALARALDDPDLLHPVVGADDALLTRVAGRPVPRERVSELETAARDEVATALEAVRAASPVPSRP